MELILAPMLKVTTFHFRKFVRITSPNTKLFTEMIVDNTILHSTDQSLLERIGEYDDNTVVQLGGSDPRTLSLSVQRIYNLTKITKYNLNCGCPSSKVQKGCFGAILMTINGLVSRIINEIYKLTGIIISIKCRNGVDNLESFDFFYEFIKDIYCNTPCREIYVHARKCILKGLSPKANRCVPPLNYEYAYRIKEEFPDMKVYLNGGIKSYDDIQYLKNLDGFMIGRQAMKDIFVFSKFDNALKNDKYLVKQNNYKEYDVEETNIEYKIECLNLYINSFDDNERFGSRIMLPLNNIFKGNIGSKNFKNILNQLMKNKSTIKECKVVFKKFIDEINIK